MKKISQTKGFTLIELVVVIVILGILAATAAPKFIDLTGDAKASVVQGVQGSINSTINMAHAKALVVNETGATGEIEINGVFYALVQGYPTRAPAAAKDNLAGADPCGATGEGCGIEDLIDLESGTDITYDDATGDFEHSEGATPDECKVTYSNATEAAGVVTPPTVVIDLDLC